MPSIIDSLRRKVGGYKLSSLKPSNADFDDFLTIYTNQLTSKLQLLIQRKVLRPSGVTLQEWRILFSLARYGSSHLRLLAERGLMDTAHASRTVAQLEKKALITRLDDPNDQRRRMVILTPMGQDLFNKLWLESREISKQLRGKYSEIEFDQLKSLIIRAVNHAGQLLEEEQVRDERL